MKGFASATRSTTSRRLAAVEALYVLTGVLALAASAKVQAPLWPVPVTAQTLAVLLVGALLGPTRGALTVLAYLTAGGAGLPVFAGPAAGAPYLAGPTGGYLVGFIPAAWLAGALVPRWAGRRGGLLAALTLATATIFAFGLAWLAALVPPSMLLMAGLVPFLPGAALKVAIAGLVLRCLRR